MHWVQQFLRRTRDVFTDVEGYVTGDQFSIADLHLVAWLSRIAKLVGGTAGDSGETVVGKLSERSGQVSGKRIGVYWDVVRERESWKRKYGDGLF